MKRIAIVNALIVLCAIPLSAAFTVYIVNLDIGEATLYELFRFTLSPLVAKVVWRNGLDGAILAVPFVILSAGTIITTIKGKAISSHILAFLVVAL